MVLMIIGRDCFPISSITVRSMPKPSRITAHWRIFFEVNFMPGSKLPLSLKNTVTAMPAMMAKMAPPMTGKSFPRYHDGKAMSRHNRIPRIFFFIKFIGKIPFHI